MRVIDPGHVFELRHLDGGEVSILRFVKREGPGYPGNVGHHEGTNLQEVLRALLSRVQYLNGQIHHRCNDTVMWHLRTAIYELELRAAERHGRDLQPFIGDIEHQPVCLVCGHIQCRSHAVESATPPVGCRE